MSVAYFRLSNYYDRPCVRIRVGDEELDVLFDIGAKFPVWTLGKERLLEFFPSARQVHKGYTFSGFGGSVTADVYCFPLDLGNGLIFPTMHALVCEDSKMPDLIIGVSALHGMITELNYLEDKSRSITFKTKDPDKLIRNLKFTIRGSEAKLILSSGDDKVDG